jgi:hypothetical protein
MANIDSYRIEIDGEWTLNDLHEFPYAYTQAYSFLYSVILNETVEDERLRITFVAHPWRGGFSAVNFFHYLYELIPAAERPKRNLNSVFLAGLDRVELGLGGFENLDELNNLAPNKLAALKMMLAFYRRARKLKDYQDDNKLKF